jgi:hypothetical protein
MAMLAKSSNAKDITLKTTLIVLIIATIVTAIVTIIIAKPLIRPEVSYNIAEEKVQPMYKIKPTGCPYGDSIPLDSPKCVAPQQETVQVQNTVQTEYEQKPQNDILGK